MERSYCTQVFVNPSGPVYTKVARELEGVFGVTAVEGWLGGGRLLTVHSVCVEEGVYAATEVKVASRGKFSDGH